MGKRPNVQKEQEPNKVTKFHVGASSKNSFPLPPKQYTDTKIDSN